MPENQGDGRNFSLTIKSMFENIDVSVKSVEPYPNINIRHIDNPINNNSTPVVHNDFEKGNFIDARTKRKCRQLHYG